jgi:hypothetical protein
MYTHTDCYIGLYFYLNMQIYNTLYNNAHMPYAHLILHTDEYDLDTDIYDHLHMSACVSICAYICMYPLLLAIHVCLYVWFLHVTYMHIQAYMH